MQMRHFGGESLQVSEVGLGCWQLGGNWGEVSDAQATAIVQAALDAGVTFFDTADVYGAGISEARLGTMLRGLSSRPMIATKVGRFPEPGWPDNFSLAEFRRHTQASLRRLRAESLDLQQAHCVPKELLESGEIFEWFRTLKQEGLIQRFGFSVESMDEAKLCLDQPDVSSLQIIFNIFRQKPIDEIFDRAERQGVALIARLPLASGLLSGKYSAETHFPEDDHRNFNRDGQAFNVGETFAGLRFEEGLELVERVRPLVPHGMTMAQFAMRWVLDHTAVTVVIPGAKSPEQARQNAAASDLPCLTPEVHDRLRQLYDEEIALAIRGPD